MPTTIKMTRNQRAQDAIVSADATAATAQGVTIVFDDRNVDRGEAARMLKEAVEIVLEGNWPRN